jgi:hypothetical protein
LIDKLSTLALISRVLISRALISTAPTRSRME